MVEQAARRGDQHIDAPVELLFLVAEGDAADEQRHGELAVFAVGLEILGDLGGKFAGGLKDERAGHPRPGAAARQAVYHRQGEGGGLACARLGNAENVASRQNLGDRLCLNGGRLRVAGFGYRLQNLGPEAEFVKFHIFGPCTMYALPDAAHSEGPWTISWGAANRAFERSRASASLRET